ncbi:MAG: hypothetical protein CMN28_04540 [Salinisphaeraceae bacterium]|nr:hypothetical protein [Salinisphaeraceae bacterium]
MELLTDPAAWIAFFTLAALEIVLGIDNIVFISILAAKLPEHQRNKARQIGLSVALVTRVLLLLSLAWVMGATKTLFEVLGMGVSWRDIILVSGGLFLLAKSTLEIHSSFEAAGHHQQGSASGKAGISFMMVVVQIGLLDIVFSLDSVITAVGLADDIPVMVAAIVVAMIVMMLAANSVGRFVEAHPTVKMLALSFLILIGVALIAEGLEFHIPKGYIYFAMAFSLAVEMLNLRIRSLQGRRSGGG